MTEQEKYYERKNREAEEFGKFMGQAPFLVIGFFIAWILWFVVCAIWPVILFVLVCFLTYYTSKSIIKCVKDTIIKSYTNFFNVILKRKATPVVDFLDSIVILIILTFIVLLTVAYITSKW